jgi:hypothetical protein
MNKRTEINAEEEIFRFVDEALRKNLQGQIETLQIEHVVGQAGLRPDRLTRMIVHGRKLKYYAEIKTTITKAQQILMRINKDKLDYPLLLIARYVNPQMAEQLKQDGIEFIDTAGNAFINRPPLYIFVKGNKPPEAVMPTPPKRAFRPAGLRIIYAFLCNPGMENKNYREIAKETGVALGTIGWFMRELKETGFLIDMGKRGKKLAQKETLLHRWVTAYPEQLKPKQTIGRYRGEHGWWKNKKLDPFKAQWGGEVAAARLTQYLQPQIITVYTTTQHLNEFLLENRLKKDPAGDVELLERFWTLGKNWQYKDMVHPILVYVDLLATGNERNIETAKIIYEQHIVRLIRED